MQQVQVAVVLKKYLGPTKMMMANGIQHTVVLHNLFGNQQLMKVERFSISIFHKVVKICGYQ